MVWAYDISYEDTTLCTYKFMEQGPKVLVLLHIQDAAGGLHPLSPVSALAIESA